MHKKNSFETLPDEIIQARIYLFRGYKVMLDRDLAFLYGVSTKVLNQTVKRNWERFPSDFMFQLNQKEKENWRSQIVTSNSEKMGIRRVPYAFTENGVAMLSGVLNSLRAVQVNIQIMRTFTKLRRMLETHKDVREKIELMEKKYDHQFKVVFDALRELLEPPVKPRRKIGFHSRP